MASPAIHPEKLTIDVKLLRRQRNWLLRKQATFTSKTDDDFAEGLVNLCDYLLDVAEGWEV